MESIEFHDRIYAKKGDQLFVFEPTWDSFRPISFVGWNGKRFEINDDAFKPDLFADFYGYGSLDMKRTCRELTREIEFDNAKEIKDPLQFWRWYGDKHVKWWFDRPCVFYNECTSRDKISWKNYLKYLEVRAKTLRKPMLRRMTRRLVPK